MDKTFIDKETKAGQTSGCTSADTDLRSEFEKGLPQDHRKCIISETSGQDTGISIR